MQPLYIAQIIANEAVLLAVRQEGLSRIAFLRKMAYISPTDSLHVVARPSACNVRAF